MKSIRQNLFLQFGTMILLFVLLLYLANTFFLETLYINLAKSGITQLYDKVNAMDSSDYTGENLYDLLVDSGLFLDFVIIDRKNDVLYLPQNPLAMNVPNKPLPKEPPKDNFTIIDEQILSENNKFIHGTVTNSTKSFIMFNGVLDNGFEINIRITMDSIHQNVTFLNQFILMVGLVIFLIALVAANVLAKDFTQPILHIFSVTDRIKNMDFSLVCPVSTNDEIGRLAENINEMSYSLKATIDNLARSNQQLTEEIDERLRIDQQRKTLLNNVSHELKTPLSLVQGYSEGLQLNLHTNVEKADFYCEVINDEAKKMDLLVSQLLEINHIQFGDFPLHKEATSALDFVRYIIKKYEPLFKESRVTFSEDLACLTSTKDPIDIIIDPLRSEQILTNLFNNAIAYADETNIIHLSTSMVPKATENGHGHLRITISNSYRETSRNELEEWWQCFYKVDKARTRENGGYGLGLAIIKAIQETDANQFGVYWEEGLIHFYVEFDVTQ